MDGAKYSRNIELVCPTCGGSQFELGNDIETDKENVRCAGCHKVFMKKELIDENAENIDKRVEEVKKEVIHDFAREIKKELKKSFKAYHNVRIK
ncbi:ECs_2282 family putative zinc-binding protein [Desulfosoma caldarium]|uniref:Uncharacterized protein n=1 Tax=Desulfosoma caldarium TaxID=610254 RepID=A0A3N1VPH1_9BACT|nr:hypothetical protein [Desulfosoma caldarium]ROR02918.1 hypothetical protein EDC27_0160 [Desulfosoma caldarium]